ncbi:MAG: pyridoxal 5'-phosphate synthase glutaminase subunit PdxT [Ruminococcus flavefaciens]|jgi:5'-phosphate synthase pdxT subunit|nr:pyridoxal 5'-phosphate synthase glutaminase subunit PdxT [Ruminococcus flavefaciens]
MRIGVLAVQGAFAEHINVLKKLGVEAFEIRNTGDLSAPFDGLILPGGESTVMKKLLHDLGLFEPLKEKIGSGLPVLGTCAGMILLAKNIDSGEDPCFGTMDITVKRNAYGRQLGSFVCTARFADKDITMRFIRAPYVTEVGSGVEILAEHDNKIVAVRQNEQLAIAFHPELTDDHTVYKLFFRMIENRAAK